MRDGKSEEVESQSGMCFLDVNEKDNAVFATSKLARISKQRHNPYIKLDINTDYHETIFTNYHTPRRHTQWPQMRLM